MLNISDVFYCVVGLKRTNNSHADITVVCRGTQQPGGWLVKEDQTFLVKSMKYLFRRNNESDPSSEYSLLGLTQVANIHYLG